MTLVLKKRGMERVQKEKSCRTKGKLNEIWIIYMQIDFMNSPGHLESLPWFSLSLAFFLSPLPLLLFGMCFGNANYFFNIAPKQNIIRKGDQRCIL